MTTPFKHLVIVDYQTFKDIMDSGWLDDKQSNVEIIPPTGHMLIISSLVYPYDPKYHIRFRDINDALICKLKWGGSV